MTKLIPQTAVQKQVTRPWVFWYWIQGAVSKEGITADLEAMKEAGIGGAYLMPIKGPASPPTLSPAVAQLTPEWWKLVKFSMSEAARLGLEMGMHVSDGFALAGGPWISPALSMQKVVFSSKVIKGNQLFSEVLPLPAIQENYYKDIQVLAYRVKEDNVLSNNEIIP
ncbi:MAG: glycosyl hydrolase, partial [Spirosomataceae bacterium]